MCDESPAMITPVPLSCLTTSDLICIQIIPTDVTHSGVRTTLSNMGVNLLSLDDDKRLPWRNELFLSTLQEKACRQVVILAPVLNTFIHALSQTVLQLGYLTFIAGDEL